MHSKWAKMWLRFFFLRLSFQSKCKSNSFSSNRRLRQQHLHIILAFTSFKVGFICFTESQFGLHYLVHCLHVLWAIIFFSFRLASYRDVSIESNTFDNKNPWLKLLEGIVKGYEFVWFRFDVAFNCELYSLNCTRNHQSRSIWVIC